MGFFSKFEGKMEDTFEGAAGKMNNAPISPVQIMKKAEKQMRREKMVSAGREFAPTLYTVLVNADDDQRLFGFYPTLAGETETRLESAASSEGLALDCKPLVRFIVDESLKHGKFDVIAEVVSAPIIAQLRDEEMQRYGMAPAGGRGYAQQPQQQPAYRQQPQAQPQQPAYAQPNRNAAFGQAPRYGAAAGAAYVAAQQPVAKPPLPQVNEDEIDYDANYGEYTFNSENFSDPHAPVNVPPVIEPEAPAYANQQHVAQPAAAGAQAAQSFAQSIPQPPAPEPVILPEQAPAFPGAFPATYPAGGAGAFPDVAHVAEAAGGTPGMPGNAAYAGVPGTVTGKPNSQCQCRSRASHRRRIESLLRPCHQPRAPRPRNGQRHRRERPECFAPARANRIRTAGRLGHYRPWLHQRHARQRRARHATRPVRRRPHHARHHRFHLLTALGALP